MNPGDALVGELRAGLAGLSVLGKATTAPTTTNQGLIVGLDDDSVDGFVAGVVLRSSARVGVLDGPWDADPLSGNWTIQGSAYSENPVASAFEAVVTLQAGSSAPRLTLAGRRVGAAYVGGPRNVGIGAGWGYTEATWDSKRVALICTSGVFVIDKMVEIFGGNAEDLSAI